jgi:hypothetical protein
MPPQQFKAGDHVFISPKSPSGWTGAYGFVVDDDGGDKLQVEFTRYRGTYNGGSVVDEVIRHSVPREFLVLSGTGLRDKKLAREADPIAQRIAQDDAADLEDFLTIAPRYEDQ